MRNIQTVLGEITPDCIGFCQCHEHLAISKGVSSDIVPSLFIDDIVKSAAELSRAKANGIHTIVDAQPVGCNRMSEALVSMAMNTGMNIIASTGFHKLIFYPDSHWIYTLTEHKLYELFLHELTIGMYTNMNTRFHPDYIPNKAGLVKSALDTVGLTPLYKSLFRAASLAAQQVNVPLMIHIEKESDPIALFHYLKESRLHAEKMIFCHMDRAIADLTVHNYLLAQGAYLEFDTIGRFKYHSDEQEANLFCQHISNGYERQLLFSLDTTRERLKTYDPDAIGLDYLMTTFIPLLKAKGLTTKQLSLLSHDNFVDVFTK